MSKRVGGVNSATVSNRGEVTDSHWVELTSNGDSVPDSSVFRKENTSYKSGVWSNPSIFGLRNLIVER